MKVYTRVYRLWNRMKKLDGLFIIVFLLVFGVGIFVFANSPLTIDSYSPTNLNFAMDETQLQYFTVNVSNIDGNNLTYYYYFNDYLLSKRDSANFGTNSTNPAINIFKFIANATSAGYNYTLKVEITDDQSNASIQWNITIKDINVAPDAGGIAPNGYAGIEIHPSYYLKGRNGSCGFYPSNDIYNISPGGLYNIIPDGNLQNITNNTLQFLSNITDVEHDNLIIDWYVVQDNIVLKHEHTETPYINLSYHGHSSYFNYTFDQIGSYIINMSADDDQYNKYPAINPSRQVLVNVFDNDSVGNTNPTMIKYIIPSIPTDWRFGRFYYYNLIVDVYYGYYNVRNSSGAEGNAINSPNNLIKFVVNATDREQDNLTFNWYIYKDNISVYQEQQLVNYSTITYGTASTIKYTFLDSGIYVVNVSVGDNKNYSCPSMFSTKQWTLIVPDFGVIPGDANGDKILNSTDVILMQQKIIGMNVVCNPIANCSNLDLDGDIIISPRDYNKLLQILMKNGIPQNVYYYDYDGDGYGGKFKYSTYGKAPDNVVSNNLDCDDTNTEELEIPKGFSINPSMTEICDGIDNNCDKQTDEGC